ncbi:tail fiber domain-containing protein [Amedibacterium intestinale]|uniref:tail fiber domain-containing protein n=1 Tax=Amedibacterium intestinale TaxID=2583452 RepID=UPI000E20033D
MIETSQEYKDLITKSGRHFLTKAVVNGKTYSGIKNLSYKGGTNSFDQISVGDAVSAYVEFTLIDTPQGMLTGQTVEPYIGLQLSSSVEWIKLGVFHMDKPKKDGNFLSITAYDNFSLMEKGFFTDLSGNQKIKTILDEQCAKIGISFRGDADDVEYDVSLLEGSTVREAVSILAAYCGKNAIIDRNGNLKFVWYTDCGVTIRSNEYKDTLEYDEEDTFINRLECATNEETLSIGTGVGIFFSCLGMTETRLNELYNRIKGFTYRTIKIDWMIARPDIEAGDLLTVITTDGTQCKVPLMDFEIHCDGGCYGTIESKGKSESEQAHEFKSPTEKKISFVYEETISVKKILVDTINAWNGNFEEIETNYLQVNKKLTALEAEIKDLDVGELTAKVAEIEKAYISKAEVEQLYATKAEIGILDTKIANIDKAIIDVAHIDDLEALNARIDNIQAGNIDTEALEAHFARIDLANIKDGCITTAMIGEGVIESAQIADGSITDAKIVTLTANKLTAGRIDASDIEVVNLNCANLTVGTINGHQITNGAIDWDKLASQVGDTINSADENASQALEDALKAYQEAQKANSAAGTAQITANGKNTVIYASAQPSTSGRKTNDIWYDTDDGYKMYYFDGKAWKAAQFGIGAIGDDAITADKIANDVNSKINEAFTNANNALGKANTAQSTADGKNTVYYQASAPPTTGRKTNDVWFDTDDGNKMYYWNGKAWTVQQFGTNAIKALSITNALIADAAINNAKIANLDAAKITTGYLSAARIKAGSLTASMLAVDTITAASGVIADAAILTANIADLAVTSAKIANASIGNAKIADAAITNAKIADAAINNAKIANLDAGKITTGYLAADRIASNSIVAGKLAANAVTTANLQADCVNADKIAAKAINAEHINGAIITSDKIVAGAITGDKIAARTIDATKIVANTITSAEIKAGTITGDNIAAGSIDAAKIKAGTITATQIAANAITSEKITADAITSTKIKTDAIKSRNYVAGSVGSFLNLADGTFTSKNLKWTADGSLTGSNVNLTGAINATSGTFKGTITGSTINGNTITGGTIKSATISGNTISGNTISGGTISGASITGGSITSGTSINVTTDLKVGNNIYLNQNVNSTKYIYFTPNTYIRNLLTSSYNYIQLYSNYRSAIYVQHNSYGNATLAGWAASNICQVDITAQKNSSYSAGIKVDGSTSSGISFNVNRAGTVKTFEFFTEPSGEKRGIVRPASDNQCYMGSASFRWNTVFSTNGVKTSSDIKQKEIVYRDMKALDFIMSLNPISYHRKDVESTGKRVHLGFSAQDVYQITKRIGYDDLSLVSAVIVNGDEEIPYDGNEIDDKYLRWSLNYSEFIPPMISVIQTHDDEIAKLKSNINELQSKLNAYILGEMEVKKA